MNMRCDPERGRDSSMAANEKDSPNIQADLLFCLFLMVLLVVLFIAALGYKPVTRHAPMIVMIPLAFMLVGQVIMIGRKLRQMRRERVASSILPHIEREKLWKAGQLLIWMIILMLMIYLVGQVVGIALFLIAFLRFASHERWILSIILGVLVTAGLHVLFEMILRIALYEGVVFKYVSGLIGT